MKDADYEKLKKRINDLVHEWRHLMKLDRMRINCTFDRSYSSEPAGMAALTTMDRWKYLEFDIHWFLPTLAEYDDPEDLEQVVVHELVHVLLAPISRNMVPSDHDYQADLMEMVTSQAEAAFLNLRDRTKELKPRAKK